MIHAPSEAEFPKKVACSQPWTSLGFAIHNYDLLPQGRNRQEPMACDIVQIWALSK
jgi:hypothetical protein